MDKLRRSSDFYNKASKRLEKERIKLIPRQEEYVYGCKSYKEYESLCRTITESQQLSELSNFDKRGFNNYHVDHIISIMCGYKNKIDPNIIGNIKNLQMLHFTQNMAKGHNSYSYIPSCSHIIN